MNSVHYSDSQIAELLGSIHKVAVVGASLKDDRPSFWVTGFLLGKGYTVYPVNPAHAGKTLLGRPVLAGLADLPEPVDLVDVFRRPEAFAATVDEVLKMPVLPRAIWGQIGVHDDEAAARAEAAGVRVFMDRSLVSEYALVYGKSHGQAA